MQSIFNSFSLVIIKIIIKFVRKISTKLVITKIKRGYFLVLIVYLIFIKT